jgi:serine/threonine protein kinase
VDRAAPEAGTLIDGVYRVVSRLGEGAMGVVVLARDELLERHVAIKLVRPELLDSVELRERFLDEARAMARITHPNVLQIHAFGEFGGAPYFVMEYVDGESLEGWLTRQPLSAFPVDGQKLAPLPDMDAALSILDQACHGVTAIHQAHTVHRDIKPSNLLLDGKLRVRVADLGLANVLHAAPSAAKDIVGTPAYMAPEIALQTELPADQKNRADVYSLACVAYELFTGKPPFEAPTLLALMMKHATTKPTPPSQLRADLHEGFDQVILRALTKDPAERTPSAEAFRRDLVNARNRSLEPVRIMVAEDDGDFRDALALMLQHEFPYAQVECYGDGASAFAAFQRGPPSVAILDLRMPGVDGMELTARLRASASANAMPIIVVTASGGPEEWKRLSALGADGFLVKPVNLKDVVTLVRRALGERSGSFPPPSGSMPAAR